MSITQKMIPEYDHEIATTRRLLERVPEDKAHWKPHPKSRSLGELAIHLAQIPSYGRAVLETPELNFNPPGGRPHNPPVFESTAQSLDVFDQNARATRGSMERAPDEGMMETWKLKNGDQTALSLPRIAALRTLMLKHMVHHRGQLSVYLRLLDVPVPPIYGPTADEM